MKNKIEQLISLGQEILTNGSPEDRETLAIELKALLTKYKVEFWRAALKEKHNPQS